MFYHLIKDKDLTQINDSHIRIDRFENSDMIPEYLK